MSKHLDTLTDRPFPPKALGQPDPERPALMGQARADICVIGAGYTGLSAALHLARAGLSVIVLEAHRAGHGASGRNGGQVWGGQRQDQITLERMVGPDDARKLWQHGQDAVTLVKNLIKEGGIDCDLQSGAITAAYNAAEVAELSDYAEHLAQHYGTDGHMALDRDAIQGLINSPVFAGGMIDHSSGHLNPYAYAKGLARLAEAAGAVIYERSAVTGFSGTQVTTAQGRVRADHIVLACNGYLGRLHADTAARIMPINNFIAVTEPLPEGAALTARHCVADTRFVVNYFRTTRDNRLVFGGGESYGARFPRDIAAKVRKPMAAIFPHLKDVALTESWGGSLAITSTRMPHLARPVGNLWISCGYSGHGVATATWAGAMISKAIQGDMEGFDTMSNVPTPRLPGGAWLRAPLLASAMTWYSIRDRLGI